MMGHLMLLTSRSSKLNQIKVDWFLEEDLNIGMHKIIELSAMNKERAKLLNAKKITMYVKEDIYLALKNAGQDIDLEFKELRRH